MSIFSIPEARNRERARLSSLFERLSVRLPQSSVSSEVTNNISSSSKNLMPPMPEEFGTVLRNLSVIRTSCGPEARQPWTSPSRSAVAFTSSSNNSGDVTSSQENDDERGLDEFQLAEEKKYPFTFKHMIHKLYRKDEWLRTVKEVLEKSKKDFKPLAECALSQNPPGMVDPHIKFKDAASLRVAKRASGTVKGRESWRMSLTEVNEPLVGGESRRALKKRCVGICKSISGTQSGDGDQDVPNKKESGKGATFIFASAISSRERPGTEIYLHFPSPQTSPSDSCFSDAEQDITAPHSPVSSITSTSPISPSCAAGMKRRVEMNHQVVILKAVPSSRLRERNPNKLSPRFSQSNKDLD